MNARDELAKVIEQAYDLNEGMATFELLAHAILAAGYVKPRTITTVEELDALPAGSVLNTDAGAWEKVDPDDADDITFWLQAGNRRWNLSRDITLPATVLYEPEAQS